MTAIHPRFTPNPIFTLDQRTHPRDSGLAALTQSAGRRGFHYGAGLQSGINTSHT